MVKIKCFNRLVLQILIHSFFICSFLSVNISIIFRSINKNLQEAKVLCISSYKGKHVIRQTIKSLVDNMILIELVSDIIHTTPGPNTHRLSYVYLTQVLEHCTSSIPELKSIIVKDTVKNIIKKRKFH